MKPELQRWYNLFEDVVLTVITAAPYRHQEIEEWLTANPKPKEYSTAEEHPDYWRNRPVQLELPFRDTVPSPGSARKQMSKKDRPL